MTHQLRKKTVVSLTQLAVVSDSRTFKIAASFARFGYRSVVVEGGFSTIGHDELPFTLISLGRQSAKKRSEGEDTQTHSTRRLWLRAIWRYAYRSRWFPTLLLFLPWLGWYIRVHFVRPFPRIPGATVYYLHSYPYFPAIFLAAWRYRARIIYDAHDFHAGMGVEEETRLDRYIGPFFLGLERRLIASAQAVVTVCDGVAGLIEKRFGRRPLVLRNNHDPRLDRAPSATIRDVLKLAPEVFLTLTIGNAKKGLALDSVIAAAEKLPGHVHFAFLGRGYRMHSEKVKHAGLTSRIHFLEPVSACEVVPFVASANASLILYYARGQNYRFALPNKFFQSIAAGLPILYPDLPEIRRLAEKRDLGLMIDTRNSDSIAEAILWLASRPKLCEEISMRVRKAAEELSWEHEETALRSLIDGVVECSGTKGG